LECIALLERYQCLPTLPTTSCVIDNHPAFCRELQSKGVELAVHGQVHVDFRSLSEKGAADNLAKAIRSFARHHIHFEGYRCPYMSCKEDVRRALPHNAFRYSSDDTIWWDVVPRKALDRATILFKRLDEFYQPQSAQVRVALPRRSDNLVEIPISVPDDMQLTSGLGLGEESIREAWTEMLRQIHARGELFVILYHPESYEKCIAAFEGVLKEARRLQPSVWVARLQDVSRWWWEKSCFGANISLDTAGRRLHLDGSERATVLIRNLETIEPTHAWDDSYRVLESRTIDLREGTRPFVGVSRALSAATILFLKDQGYIVDESEHASQCSLYLGDSAIDTWSEVQIVNYVESSDAPLVRFSRWPDQAKSALCITGDLDALSLRDYASRLFSL
jgi:hypothetical protein